MFGAFTLATCVATVATGEHYVIDVLLGLLFGFWLQSMYWIWKLRGMAVPVGDSTEMETPGIQCAAARSASGGWCPAHKEAMEKATEMRDGKANGLEARLRGLRPLDF